MSKGLILLVEDDEVLSNLFAGVLTEASFDVEQFHSLAEIESRIDKEPVASCVILDMYLPNGKATEFLDDFENRHPSTRIPIIAITGSPSVTEDAVKLAGVQALLTKPVMPKELIQTVSQVIVDFVSNHDPIMRSVKELRAELACVRSF